jgi:hypothetical protein
MNWEDFASKAGEEVVENVVEKTTGIDGNTVKTVKAVAESGAAVGAAVSAATGLSVAATSGAGITSGLAAAGGVVGGGMAAAPAVLAAGPAYAGAKIMNETLFKEQPDLSEEERDARAAARTATNIGAAAGVAGAGLVTVAGGASGAAIMGTLARVTQLLFPLTILSISTILKCDGCTQGVKRSYPVGNRPSKKRDLAHRNIEFLTECL